MLLKNKFIKKLISKYRNTKQGKLDSGGHG